MIFLTIKKLSDLLTRTGGLCRVSNFLLLQAAYVRLFFLRKYWPDFNKQDILKALDDYSNCVDIAIGTVLL
jgi:undecaprenyl diphosphate synthase